MLKKEHIFKQRCLHVVLTSVPFHVSFVVRMKGQNNMLTLDGERSE